MALHLAQEPAADALLDRDPLALVLGMLLDQQFPMERAFAGPWLLAERLGVERLDAAQIAAADPEQMVAVFTGPPAVHRYPRAMAARAQALCRHLVDSYGGDASALWSGVESAADLLARLRALPGFGEQKARIFLALLGKQLQVRPDGWRAAAQAYGEDGSRRSVADVVDADTLAQVRAYKQETKQRARAAQHP